MKYPKIRHLSIKKKNLINIRLYSGQGDEHKRVNFSLSFKSPLLAHLKPTYFVLINFEV